MNVKPRNGQLSVALTRRLHRALTANKEQIYHCLQDLAPEVLRTLSEQSANQRGRHRHTPLVWFTLCLPKLPLRELRTLLLSRQLIPAQQTLINNELKRRQDK